jgi:hypothetical protein
MTSLKDYINKNSTFVDWKNKPQHTFEFVSAGVIQNPFDADSETIEYNVIEEGIERTFRSQSLTLAKLLDGLEGQTITLERIGQGTKTSWKLVDDKDAEAQ